MKKHIPLAFIALLSTILTSCDLVAGIFKAGLWAGVMIVILVLALIIWLVSKIFGGR